MTQGPSDDRPGSERDDGWRARDSGRLTLLARASTAVRRAHTDEHDIGALAGSEEEFLTALENRALRDAEREARQELEAGVRLFAARLRAEGAPPEVAVRRVKSVVEPVVFSARDHDGTDVEWRRGVVGDVVKWFVQAYYGA